MARFVAYSRRVGTGYLLDCQADLLSGLNTRFVIPLLPEAEAPSPAARLDPVFHISGARMVMVTQFASAVRTTKLGDPVASLAAREHDILNALDMQISGY